jgi:hypothetical protein
MKLLLFYLTISLKLWFSRNHQRYPLWRLAGGEGWNVAHEAARYGWPPEGFNQWKLKDYSDQTGADVAKIKT